MKDETMPKVRLMLDFDGEEALADFLDEFMPMIHRHIDPQVELAVWKADILDYNRGTGVTKSRSYIVKRSDDARLERFVVNRERKY